MRWDPAGGVNLGCERDYQKLLVMQHGPSWRRQCNTKTLGKSDMLLLLLMKEGPAVRAVTDDVDVISTTWCRRRTCCGWLAYGCGQHTPQPFHGVLTPVSRMVVTQ
jgi:hypothetical protein